MSYFDIYKKRVNRYGSNLQDRIQGKKEHDFEVFMNSSPNLVRARDGENGDIYKAVLQTKEYDQDEVVDYLLVSLDKKIPMGTVIYTVDSRHTDVNYEGKNHYISIEEKLLPARRWINYAIDPYTSTGYNRYTVVELESELSWVLDGIKYTSFAHATGGGSGARDKNINLKFKTQFSESGVYLPNKRYSIVMPTHPSLKKNMKITLGGETWRVAGFDNISVKGVSYVTLEETLKDEREDIPIANYGELNNWTVTTSLGENFTIQRQKMTELSLMFFYKNYPRKVNYSILDNERYSINITEDIVQITSTAETGPTSLKVVIEGWNEEDFFEIPFIVGTSSGEQLRMLGPDTVAVGETAEFIFKDCSKNDYETVTLKNNNAKIISKVFNENEREMTLQVKGAKIGAETVNIANNSFDFEIVSMWLGGN